MLISASRRTDIPRFYYDWFLRRLREGFALVRNPQNAAQTSRVSLSPETIDGIVFWSKDPSPMLGRLGELGAYPWYIQYTLNAYGEKIERALPPLEARIEMFRQLAEEAPTPSSIVWRYSPVIVSGRYPEEYHLEKFQQIAEALRGKTRRCNLSFLDFYEKIRPKMEELGARKLAQNEMAALAKQLELIAHKNEIELCACGGSFDLEAAGIKQAKCVDAEWLSDITGLRYRAKKDAGQRAECRCDASVDIGSYNSCRNGCVYCYANCAGGAAGNRADRFNLASPMLCGSLRESDIIKERAMPLLALSQTSLF